MKIWDFKKKCARKCTFLGSRIEISIFRQNAISKRLNACLGTKNEVEEGNGLFFQNLAKIWKKGKKGTTYTNLDESDHFFDF